MAHKDPWAEPDAIGTRRNYLDAGGENLATYDRHNIQEGELDGKPRGFSQPVY